MRFRHAIHLASENFASVFKLLLYRLFTAAIIGSLAYVILSLGLSAITGSEQVMHIRELVSAFLNALVTGQPEILQSLPPQFNDAFTEFLKLIAFNTPSIIGCVIGLVCLYLVSRFVNGLALFSIANIVNDRMSTYSRTSFSQSYFKSIGKAALYQVIYVPLCFAYDALMLGACWFFFFYAPSFLPSWGAITVAIAISLTLTAIVALEALKMTLISSWIPAIVADNLGITHAFRASVRKRQGFAARYGAFVAAVYLIIGVNVLFAIATVGSGLLITVPLSYIFLLCLQFVNYYLENGKKYFLTRNTIVDSFDTQIS